MKCKCCGVTLKTSINRDEFLANGGWIGDVSKSAARDFEDSNTDLDLDVERDTHIKTNNFCDDSNHVVVKQRKK